MGGDRATHVPGAERGGGGKELSCSFSTALTGIVVMGLGFGGWERGREVGEEGERGEEGEGLFFRGDEGGGARRRCVRREEEGGEARRRCEAVVVKEEEERGERGKRDTIRSRLSFKQLAMDR